MRRFFSSNLFFRGKHIDSVKILYGSQTGTAHMFADQLSQEIASRNVDAQVIDLADVQPEKLFQTHAGNAKELLVFVTACYGVGT